MSSPPEEMMSNLDLIEKHPPERRERQKRYVVLYSCCCCCCCCLHTVGGAIGAACGGDFRAESDASATASKRYPSSQALYWTSFLLTIPLAMMLWAMFGQTQQAPIQIGLSIVLLGPVWLLAGSAVMAIRLALRRDLPSRSEYWRQLGRITVGTVLGSVAGAVVMIAILLLLAAAL